MCWPHSTSRWWRHKNKTSFIRRFESQQSSFISISNLRQVISNPRKVHFRTRFEPSNLVDSSQCSLKDIPGRMRYYPIYFSCYRFDWHNFILSRMRLTTAHPILILWVSFIAVSFKFASYVNCKWLQFDCCGFEFLSVINLWSGCTWLAVDVN